VKTYAEKLKDPRWQKKRLRVMERDKFECRDCGATDKSLQVHHCKYSKGEPWDTDDQLLMTLCDDCHKERQAVENEMRDIMGWAFSNSPITRLRTNLAKMRRSGGNGLRMKIILVDASDRVVE
jgi:5-methylcytosine-specific restriction endonuclease McrA